MELGVLRFIDHAHAATTQFFNDAVVGDGSAEDERGVSHLACILRPRPDNCREQGLSPPISQCDIPQINGKNGISLFPAL